MSNALITPWTLAIDQDGTEDVVTIRDAAGESLATSRPFWMPEHDEPVPPTLAAIRVMAAAPKLLEFVELIARMSQDGEEVDGRDFVVENDDAVSTLNELIDYARSISTEARGKAAV